jgi:hypothetical protein
MGAPETANGRHTWLPLSLCQMRRLSDRPRSPHQLYAFNTTANEKINADNLLCRLTGAEA